MTVPMHVLIDSLTAAFRSGSDDKSSGLEEELLLRTGDVSNFLTRWAELAYERGEYDAAERRWFSASVLRPSELSLQRAVVNAKMMAGNIDRAIEHLESLDFAAGGIDNFFWHIGQRLRAGLFEDAALIIDKARALDLFPISVIQVACANLLLEEGLDESAQDQLERLSLLPPDEGGLHAKGLLSGLLVQHGQYEAAANSHLEIALERGSQGSLNASIALFERFVRPVAALAAIARFTDRWPNLEAAVAPISSRVSNLMHHANAAVSEHGALRPFDANKIYGRLEKGETASQVLWARQALVAMADDGALPLEQAGRFVLPYPSWEDSAVNYFVVLAYHAQAPEDPRFAQRIIKTIALSQTQRQGLFRRLSQAPEDAFDEDLLVYAIFSLRQFGSFSPRVRLKLMPFADRLRERVRERLPDALPNFKVFAGAHLQKLGFDPPVINVSDAPLESRRAIHQGAAFGLSPWRTGRVYKSAAPRSRPPSVVLALSGQMRGFERAWPSVAESIARPLHTPVVMTLWDTSTNAIGRHAKRLERTLPADLLARIPPLERFTDTFARRYPQTSEVLFGQITVDPRRVDEILSQSGVLERYVEVESESTYDHILVANQVLGVNHILKMYAKFRRVNEMISDLEHQRGETFTHVCWIRPDARINRFSAQELLVCTHDQENGWGEASRPTTVGDYVLFLPRRNFAKLGEVFTASVYSDDLQFFGFLPLPWNRLERTGHRWMIQGPETIASTLFSSGIFLQEMRNLSVELLGYMPPEQKLRELFAADEELS